MQAYCLFGQHVSAADNKYKKSIIISPGQNLLMLCIDCGFLLICSLEFKLKKTFSGSIDVHPSGQKRECCEENIRFSLVSIHHPDSSSKHFMSNDFNYFCSLVFWKPLLYHSEGAAVSQ